MWKGCRVMEGDERGRRGMEGDRWGDGRVWRGMEVMEGVEGV